MKTHALIITLLTALCAVTLHAQTRTQVRLSDSNEQTPPTPEAITQGFLIGINEASNQRTQKAQEIFNTLAELTADRHTASLYYLAELSIGEQDFHKAEHYIKRALQSDENNDLYLKVLCDTYLQRGMFAQADSTIQHLLALDSTDQQVLRLNVYTVFSRGDKERAMKLSEAYEAKYGFDRLLFECRKDYLIEQRRLEDLLQSTDRAIAASSDPEFIILKAQILASTGQDSAAMDAYDLAIKIAPQANVYVALADYWRVKRDTTQYMAAIAPILRDTTVNPGVKIGTLTEAFKMGVHPQSIAARALTDTLLTYDNSLIVKEFNAEIRIHLKDLSGARNIYEEIYKLQTPISNRNLEFLTRLHMELNDNRQRLYYLVLEGMARYPENALYPSLGVFAFDTPEDHRTALSICDLAIKSAPDDSLRSQAYTLRGDYHNKRKSLAKATADYKKAITYNPLNATAYNNYAYALAVAGKSLDTALAMANKAVDLEPENFTFLDTKAWIYYGMRQFAEAKTFIIRAVNLTKTPPVEILLHAGDIYSALNDSTTANYYWKWAAKEGATSEQMGDRLLKDGN